MRAYFFHEGWASPIKARTADPPRELEELLAGGGPTTDGVWTEEEINMFASLRVTEESPVRIGAGATEDDAALHMCVVVTERNR